MTENLEQPTLAVPVDLEPSLSEEFTPEAIAAAKERGDIALEKVNEPLRKLDPTNPRDKFILDVLGEPASVVIFGEMKTGKTIRIAKACPNYLWVVHSKKVMRAYAQEMRKDPTLPALKFMCCPDTKRDPKTGVVTRNNVYAMLMQIIDSYSKIKEKWGIEGLVFVEITQFMLMLEAEAENADMHPEFFVNKKNDKTGQFEETYNFFKGGDWLMKFLMYLLRVVPSKIGAHVVLEANKREPKFNEKTGMRKGGAQFLTENQAVSAGHEADYTWEIRHCVDRAVGEFKVEIVTRGDDLVKRGGRDGGLCSMVEPDNLPGLFEKVGLHFAD